MFFADHAVFPQLLTSDEAQLRHPAILALFVAVRFFSEVGVDVLGLKAKTSLSGSALTLRLFGILPTGPKVKNSTCDKPLHLLTDFLQCLLKIVKLSDYAWLLHLILSTAVTLFLPPSSNSFFAFMPCLWHYSAHNYLIVGTNIKRNDHVKCTHSLYCDNI